ncbi:MAG: M20 family metallopeptidase [Acidimicrobiales bacterium]|jgi:amidohydrolase
MTRTFSDDLPQLLDDVGESMVELRHDLHAHPELAFQEHRTTNVVRDRLVDLGWELASCPTETGAVAVLRGARPGRRIMIRADIDGLPVTEENAITFASVNDGVMHACGHDVHTAGLLGIADLLSRRQESLAGEFTLLFQPAEEALGGALAMIEGGVLTANPVDVVIGAHVSSLAPLGFVGTKPGVMMSEAASLSIHIKGKGGHGAMASVEGNVILAVSHLAPRLGEVVNGLSFEGTNCACSAGVISAGTAMNVVPRHAVLRGTLRTFTHEQHVEALERLQSLLREVESMFVVACTLDLTDLAPAVVNNAHIYERVMESATKVVGASGVMTIPPFTPSDDVSEFLNRVPGCYMFIGGANADGTSGMHHSPDFQVQDGACRILAGVLAQSAVDLAQL